MLRFATLTRIVIGLGLILGMNHGLLAMHRPTSPAPSSVSDHPSLDSIRDGEFADASTDTVCARGHNLNTTLPTMCEGDDHRETFIEYFQSCYDHLVEVRYVLEQLHMIPSTQQQAIRENHAMTDRAIDTLTRLRTRISSLSINNLTLAATSFYELTNTASTNVSFFIHTITQQLRDQRIQTIRNLSRLLESSTSHAQLYTQWLSLYEGIVLRETRCSHLIQENIAYGQDALRNVQQYITELHNELACYEQILQHLNRIEHHAHIDSPENERLSQRLVLQAHDVLRLLQGLSRRITDALNH